MNHNPVGWFEIYVQDMDRAKRFYESVFQVKLEHLSSPEEMNVELWSFLNNQRPNGRTWGVGQNGKWAIRRKLCIGLLYV